MTHDGLGKYLKERITKAEGSTVDIVEILKETKTDVVVSYLPVGSEQATKWYVEQILEAGCAFVNCIPVFIAREDYWNNRFKKAGLPIIGDDIKSQVGATIMHRTLARLFADRGVKILRTSQLNVGGNMDFFNMLERERLESKKISKTNAVTSIMDYELPATDVHVGPSDYVPWLEDRKWAHIRVEGQAFGDVPLSVELKMEVWDSPNSAGIVIDAVRCCKLGLNHGLAGQLDGPSSYLMKSPHNQRPDDQAREATETFIAEYARSQKAAKAARKAAEKVAETKLVAVTRLAREARRPRAVARLGGGQESARSGWLADRVATLAAADAAALVGVRPDDVLALAAVDARGGAGGRDVDRVVALAALDLVAAVGGVDRVLAGAAIELVGLGAAVEVVAARAADQRVLADARRRAGRRPCRRRCSRCRGRR